MNAVRFFSFALGCVVGLAGCSRGEALSETAREAVPNDGADRQTERSPLLREGPRAARTMLAVAAAHRALPSDSDAAAGRRDVSFVEVADERGLRFVWPQQPRPMTALDAFGAGCAAFDGDNDDWQDVLLVAAGHARLFRNSGQGRFEDVTLSSGLAAVEGKWTGCAVGDYNGDGLVDILLTGYRCLALCKNAGGLRFQVATHEAGLDAGNDGLWASSAGFIDLDGDAWLDLVVLNYAVFGPDSTQYCEYAPGIRSGCNPKIYPPERGTIWRNTGAGGFEAVPAAQGMQETHGLALVLAFTDLDGDGRPDFYIGNDGIPADLMHNLGAMRFENIAPVAGVAVSDSGSAVSAMGADWADFDRDGALDLALTNWQGAGFVIFRGLGRKLFMDCSRRTELSSSTMKRMGFGAKWTDFENDGWPDLFFVNGHVYDNSAEIHGPGVPFRQPLGLFSNRQGSSTGAIRKFVDVVPFLGDDVQRAMVGRGSATADFDNDGRVDLLAVDFEGPVRLFENRTETGNHWLTLDLRGRPPNVFAYGARAVGQAGERSWTAELSPASSYLSSSDPRIHWGLGAVARLDSLTIRWPSGSEQTLRDIAADQFLRIEEDSPSSRP